jgi:periplasmic copper chaperone A
MMNTITVFTRYLMTLGALLAVSTAQAEVGISDAWVRASTPGQTVAAAYLTLNSKEDVALVYAETERAGSVEMHTMTMQNGIMKMRSLEELAIPAGKPVKLAPGGLHLMLFDFPTPFKSGEKVKFRLCFKNKQGKIEEQFVVLAVKSP